MSILEDSHPLLRNGEADQTAIANLHDLVACQRAAFLRDTYPSLEERRRRLQTLVDMMSANVDRVVKAMSNDYGNHPETVSAMTEVGGPVARAQFASERLDRYMAPSPRDVDPAFFGTATAEIRYQPKGVVGIIAPWNFPFDLAAGPLVDVLAAGNRAIIKPSEFTPACAALLAQMVTEHFSPDCVAVVEGGPDLARAFSEVRWDHLLYTGSPGVGRQVMMAAAKNLTPVTLELGGKCPAILAPEQATPGTVADVIGLKLVKSGQVCISVDYVLVQREEVDRFVDLATDYVRRTVPDYSRSADCTGIVSERHLDRILSMIAQARSAGTRVVEPEEGGSVDRATRRMPLSLVIDPQQDATLMREEIFGPVLPIVPYDTLDDAIAFVNRGERPLGLYVFGDPQATDRVLERTVSGGAAVNCCAMQGALPSMGFGGIGNSGMGRHHGEDGFHEFSNPRGVFTRGTGDAIQAFYPPYPAYLATEPQMAV